MKRDPITQILAALLVLAATATAALCYWYLQCTRDQQQAQAEAALVNQNRSLMQSLAAESSEYARKNPAILPVLQRLGIRPRMDSSNAAGATAQTK